MGKDIVIDWVQVVGGGNLWSLRWPWISCRRVFLVLRLFDHSIKQVLERTLLCRWFWADVVSGAPRESLCSVAHACSIEFSIRSKTQFESAFSCTKGDLASRYWCESFFKIDSATRLVHSLNGISGNKVFEVLDGVNSCVACLSCHETSIWSHWLWLGNGSAGHFDFYYFNWQNITDN